MCDQAQEPEFVKAKGPVLEIGAPCVKCKVRPIAVVVRQAAYCKECFQEVAYHKYRFSVSKGRNSKDPERILVAVSTGAASRLLLYFTQLAKLQEPGRKNMDNFLPVHVKMDEDEDDSELVSFVKELGLELMIVPISAALSIDEEKFTSILGSAKTPSAKLDLLRILRTRLLATIAKEQGCSKVYLGDTNDRMAINAMTDVCAGRGSTIPWSQLPAQPVAAGLMAFVRPLRDLQALEVPAYLEIIGKRSGCEDGAGRDTIYGLTDSFISGLAKDFAATPSIITRTVGKIHTEQTPRDTKENPFCALCWCPIVGSEQMCHPCQGLLLEVPSLELDMFSRQ